MRGLQMANLVNLVDYFQNFQSNLPAVACLKCGQTRLNGQFGHIYLIFFEKFTKKDFKYLSV